MAEGIRERDRLGTLFNTAQERFKGIKREIVVKLFGGSPGTRGAAKGRGAGCKRREGQGKELRGRG